MNNNRKEYFKTSENKPQRYTRDSFTKELIGKPLKITLLNDREISGRLLDLGMYDVKIQTAQGPLIILKSPIATVEVIA